MNDRIKSWAISVGITLVAVLLVGVGLWVGKYLSFHEFESRLERRDGASTMAKLLKEDEREGVALAYEDSEAALRNFDWITYAAPTTPTPFVGSAPAPGEYGTARINSMQFRADRELDIPKPPNTFRIFLVGGSTAFGVGAPSQHSTIGAYLEKLIAEKMGPGSTKKYEVWTMAQPAWASTHERIVIENRLVDFEPDLVISFSGNNDVHWGRRGRNILWFRSYGDEFYRSLLDAAYSVSGRGRLPDVVEVEDEPVDSALVIERLLRNVDIANFVLGQKKVPYVFALQPTMKVSRKEFSEREQDGYSDRSQDYFRACYAAMIDTLGARDSEYFRFVDLSALFDHMGPETEIFLDSYHFGDRGNRIIAQGLLDGIADLL